jgi:N-acetylmuramoyl-L-alanine amidase
MSKIIALGAGHGYNTAGKRCLKSIDPNQTREWFLNDRIADLVETALKNYDCKVLRLDDTTGAKDISLSARVSAANKAKADIYVSIHHNAGINGGSGGGTVVYCWPDMPSIEAANRLYNAVIAKTGLVGNRANRIANGKNLYEINATNMIALLLENGFMDSTYDTPIILTEDHAKKTAEGIVDFLVSELGLAKKATVVQDNRYYPPCDKKYYTIWSGLTSIGVNASYSHRVKIAKVNKISGYIGTAKQNTQMLNLLKAGLLLKA